MSATTWLERDEWQSLDKRSRDLLVAIVRGSVEYGSGRIQTQEMRALIGQGLVFQSHVALTATEKGITLAERIA